MSGGQGETQMGGCQDRHRRGGLGGEALRRLDMHQTTPHGAHDAPPARIGAQADGEARCGDDPPVGAGTGLLVAARHKHQRDDPHSLLPIRRAVGQRHQRCGDPLTVAEELLGVGVSRMRDAVGQCCGQRCRAPGHHRCDDGR